MISLYCRLKEGNRELCRECGELLAYAERRLDGCNFGSQKSDCKRCAVHCYRPDMKERMRVVMRYVGPRMLFYYPGDALMHLFCRGGKK